MIESTRPKLNRFNYGVLLLGVTAAAAAPLASPAIAAAQKYWDIEYFDACRDAVYADYQSGKIDFDDYHYLIRLCCKNSDGVWNDAQQQCQAPPGDVQDSRQLPGNVQIPKYIATAPTVTKTPPRPIQVPSDIAAVSVSQRNESLS